MKRSIFKSKIWAGLVLMTSMSIIYWSCKCPKCPECPPTGTTTLQAGGTEAATTAAFHHLRLDSAILVNSFMTQSPSDFKKMMLAYRVKDFGHFPDSLTLAAYATKNNNDVQVGNPQILTILPETVTLSTDIDFSTLELSRAKLINLVGSNGQARRYSHLVFIPYLKDSVGRKFLSYRVECRPPSGGGAETSETTNPCPPFKPE
jgi:hypothetical protein